MQTLITKYGLAAHLALLTVAPLFLFPFCGEGTITVVMLWLSALAFVWILMEPSVLAGEMLRDARNRVSANVFRDPLFWVSLVLVVLTGVRALNSGVALAYDAETLNWHLRAAAFPLLPSSCGGVGKLLFASAVALAVILQGARHAMGRSARLAYALLASALAGIAAVAALLAFSSGHPGATACVKFTAVNRNFAAIAFGVHFLAGSAALVGVFERRWNRAIPLLAFSIGGTGAGLFAFADPVAVALFVVADLPVLIYSFFYAHRVLRSAGEFKCLVVFGLSVTIAVVLVIALLPQAEVAARMAPIVSNDLLPEKFLELRKVLGSLALKVWREHPWLGTGLGTLANDLRLTAADTDWTLIPHGQSLALNGWWQLLVERGIVGAVAVALPLAFLLFSYGRGVCRWIFVHGLPHPMSLSGLFSLLAVVALTFVDATVFRPELVLIVCAMLAISAHSFPKEKSNG